jgi:hypothetical protein
MPEFCSCGAELPPDARFCHKCGRPQRAEFVPEEDPPPFTPPPRAEPEYMPPPRADHGFALLAAPPAALNFRNPMAVRVGLLAASLGALLSWIPVVNLGFFIWWLAAGFFAVWLYRRRTGQVLDVRGGLRLGWITGVLTFAIMAAMFAVTIVPVAMGAGGLGALLEQQLRNMPGADPSVQEAIRLFQTPAGVILFMSLMLAMFFVMITVLCTAGGALAARVVGRDD